MAIDCRLSQEAQQKAKRIHRKYSSLIEHDRMSEYIDSLLPLELQCAQSDSEVPRRLPDQTYHHGLLVLLVGFALDPLLQAICAYRPKKVILVLNRDYGKEGEGEKFGKKVASHITQLAQLPEVYKLDIEAEHIDFIVLNRDHPEQVFRKLREELLPVIKDYPSTVLDITGGKKSMVTGAFMFGAFTGVHLSYVDFDEYDPKSRVPLGYTCRIGLLANPYQVFQIAAWKRVEQLYETYAFNRARQLLEKEILPSMKGWFTTEEIKAVRILKLILWMHEQWDLGDYVRAFKTYGRLKKFLFKRNKFRLPTAIAKLGEGDFWPNSRSKKPLIEQLESMEIQLISSLSKNIYKLIIYIYDETEKVSRLIEYNEDARSGLLRVIGVDEILLRSRIIVLVEKGWIEIEERGENSEHIRIQWSDIRPQIQNKELGFVEAIDKAQIKEVIDILLPYETISNCESDRKPLKISCKTKGGGGGRRRMSLKRLDIDAVPSLATVFALETQRELRNKAIHTYLSVPKDIAQDTLDIVKRDRDDFAENWATLLAPDLSTDEVITESMPWRELCEACGVTFLPLAHGEQPHHARGPTRGGSRPNPGFCIPRFPFAGSGGWEPVADTILRAGRHPIAGAPWWRLNL